MRETAPIFIISLILTIFWLGVLIITHWRDRQNCEQLCEQHHAIMISYDSGCLCMEK